MSPTPTTSAQVPIIFGAGIFGYNDPNPIIKIDTPSQLQPLLNAFRAHGHTQIDTSRIYPSWGIQGGSETLLGKTDIASWATIDTKVLSGPGAHAPQKIAESIATSLRELNIPRINTIYLHRPDRTQSLSSVIPAIASAAVTTTTTTTEEGGSRAANRWAISNYSVAEVEEIVRICAANSLPLPHCYQGHYNAIARTAESELLPLLRRHGIAFYAYSPTAGGAFNPQSTRMVDQGKLGGMTRSFYGSEKSQAAIEAIREMAAEHGVLSGHEVALRWARYHSALDAERGDAMAVGASSEKQLEETLIGLDRGPLPREVADAVSRLWEEGGVRETAPDYSPFLEEET